MSTIKHVSRMTGPQLAEGLDKLRQTDVQKLRHALVKAKPGREAFVDGVNARLAKDGEVPGTASAEELKRAVSLELAKLARQVSTSGVRKAGETISLAVVEKNFGNAMRALLEKLEQIHIEGRLDHEGRVPLTEDTAREVAGVYAKLGLDANDDSVVKAMAKLYETFRPSTLDSLHRKFPELLPDRTQLSSERAAAALRAEAEKVRDVVNKQHITTMPKLVQVMQSLGYDGFDAGRLGYLRKKVGDDVVPSLAKQHTPEEFAALAEKIRAFINKHPAATPRIIAKQFSVSHEFVVEAAEVAGIALDNERSAKILDPYDPVCDGLVRWALLARKPGEGVDVAARTLNANAEFVRKFGHVDEKQIGAYVDEHLSLLKKAPSSKDRPAWVDAKPGVRDRAYAELAAFFYSVPDVDEPGAFAMLRAFDPKFTKYALKDLRRENPDLNLVLRIVDKTERARIAFELGAIVAEMPDATIAEIADVAWQRGLPRMTESKLDGLRKEFPDVIEQRVDRSNKERLTEIDNGVAAYLEKHPQASVAEVAKAVDARPTQVVMKMRRYRAEHLDAGQTRFTEVERALVEKIVRNVEPGDTLGDVRGKLLADKTFRARHPDISINTMRDMIAEVAPDAADWKTFNLTVIARVLDRALQDPKNAGKSLSKLAAELRAKHPGFPSYVMLCGTTARSFEKHIDAVPQLEKYLVDGRLKFSSHGPAAVLSEELAHIMAKAFRDAPPEWKNEQIYASLLSQPKIAKKFPVITESTLTGLRTKFPGIIPKRTAPAVSTSTKVATGDAAADAKKLAKAIEAQQKRGEKVKLDGIAKEWGVDPQYFRRLIRRFPAEFPEYKKRYEITEHIARTMGLVIQTMPMGTTIDDAAVLLEKSGLFPPDMKIQKTLLISAQAKFPALVPSLKSRSEELFLRLVCRDLALSSSSTSLADVFAKAKAECGQLPVSLERFHGEIVPRWEKSKEKPAWVKAVMVAGKVSPHGLSRRDFPKEDLAAVERDLAQLAEVPARLEMLERIIARKNQNTFADCNVVCIQHLLGSNFRFVEAVNRLGAKKEDILTVGIPYSTSETVARTMNEGGLETFTPPLNIAAWERQVEDALYQSVEKSKQNGKKIVVFDDGGLVAKLLHEKPWFAEHKHLFRIVEQTTRGITVAKQYDLDVPLVNYAQDPAKNLEGVMIGDVVVDRIFKRLDALGKRKDLKGMPVTCVGAGVIGLPTALDMARAGAKVKIFDLDAKARAHAIEIAKKEGLDIEVLDDPAKAFSGAKMIIGCTGHTSIAKEAFANMADGCMLVSTSSKLVEIDMGLLDEKAQGRRTIVDDKHRPPTCTYELDDGRKITVLADGFPVNFDGEVNCVDPADIQLTHAGMLLAGIQASWENLDHGLLAFDDKLRKELLDDWAEVKSKKSARAAGPDA